MLLDIFLAIVFTEAITELVVKSEIFKPLRKYFFDRRDRKVMKFLHELFDCGYCFSVWAGLLSLFLVTAGNDIIALFMWAIVIHRFSNAFHNIMDRLHGIKFMDKE